ncbi:Sentrin-specific protease [Diplonema papillatum]|nr:Sentrin-specific protease [Diplonema papillatum]KAJ9446883.1 Sentrin-specific protease [Diplonema papillatum]|eukprot:gene16419-25171_t
MLSTTQQLVAELLESAVEAEVTALVKRRKLADDIATAVLRSYVETVAISMMPPLHQLLQQLSYVDGADLQRRYPWKERKRSQPITDDDHTLLQQSGFCLESSEDNAAVVGKLLKKDFFTLFGKNWLNDAIINAYIQLLVDRAAACPELPSVHSMGTHFFTKMQACGSDYQHVKRWTNKVDVFSFDLLLMPLNIGKHWALAVVDFKNSVLGYYNSLGSDGEPLLDMILKWLQEEHEHRKGVARDFTEIRRHSPGNTVPQQDGYSDCGVFLCMYCNCLTAGGSDFAFSQQDVAYLRARMALELLVGRVASAPSDASRLLEMRGKDSS